MMDNNLPVADADQDKKETPPQSIEKSPEGSVDMPENKKEVPKVQSKPKLSEWTEVTGQTLEQLKEKAKATYGRLSSGSDKEKTSDKK